MRRTRLIPEPETHAQQLRRSAQSRRSEAGRAVGASARRPLPVSWRRRRTRQNQSQATRTRLLLPWGRRKRRRCPAGRTRSMTTTAG